MGQLGLADAVDAFQGRAGGRTGLGDLGQGAVMEDHIGRHVLGLGLGRPPGAQGLEQGLIGGTQRGHGFARTLARAA